MSTVMTHAVVALALGGALGQRAIPPRLLAAGAIATVLPDADVITFKLGIAYADGLGHRGASHSLLFAAGVGLGVALLWPWSEQRLFAPWRPIAVSPIGADFFSLRGLRVLGSEVFRVWLPALLVAGTGAWLRSTRRAARTANGS